MIGIHRSVDLGSNWTKVASPLDSGMVINDPRIDTISTLSSLWASGAYLLVGMKAYSFHQSPYAYSYANGGGLCHLLDVGGTWTVVDSSFTGRSVFALESKGSDIFAGTDTGVYHSEDFGSTWTDVSTGMKNIYVSSLFVSGSYLHAYTINGLWRRPLSEITSVARQVHSTEVPAGFGLAQNYPNPFNPTTSIAFTVPHSSYVTLKVYDLLGQEVAILVQGMYQPGTYEVTFDGSRIGSGAYFYRLQAGSVSITKRLIFVK